MVRLVQGIEAMALRFYANGQWQKEWDAGISGLPELVEIELQLHTTGEEPNYFISAFELPAVESYE